ncbi:hypothetical protein DKM27_13035 [Mycobacterium tuberculosis variant bovis]|uniref:HNH endonuclease n=1 Tax=Mycobacterium avium TaxID=1764 RepID=UPI000A05D38D|nr:HNH endonuclease signature motif containing protein [Mycobacterium avium]TXA41425.1 hypothetical protein DKM27_13035 [Mycobacterium tuberculosis variant bovis]
MARGRADIANTALRIFLQEMGAEYDKERGLIPYRGGKDFAIIKEFFGGNCCYCNAAPATAQDHLIPMNKSSLGLHAWGNIVPACGPCNAAKQGRDWKDFIIQRAGTDASERYTRMQAFLAKYGYQPKGDLREVAETLYEEVGVIAMALIASKIKRLSDTL